MIDVYIIEEIERERRKERREPARIWISDPEDPAPSGREKVSEPDSPRVIVIDL